MKKSLLLVLSMLVFLASCNQKKENSQIVIHSSGIPDSTFVYLNDSEKEMNVDSGYFVNNELVFTVEVNEPTGFFLIIPKSEKNEPSYAYIWKEADKKLLVNALNGNLTDAQIEGSDIYKQMDSLKSAKAPLKNKIDSMYTELRAMPSSEKEKRVSLWQEIEKQKKIFFDIDIDYIKNHPNELYSAILLNNQMRLQFTMEQTKEAYAFLSPEVKASKWGMRVKNYIDLNKSLQRGDQAVDFQLPDLNGKPIKLSDYKGKYVVLDFWASGCGPCRMESPFLRNAYERYHDKGLEILTISLDKNRHRWETAIQQDSIPWTTVSDLKGTDGDVPNTYGVFGFPTYFIIDPEGIVIDHFFGMGRIVPALNSIFEKKETQKQ